MSSFEFVPFDDEDGDILDILGGALTCDDLDLDTIIDLQPDLSAMLRLRPCYERRGWWSTSEAEEFHLNLPAFTSADERMRWMITDMAKRVSDDPMAKVHEHNGEMVSLNDLLMLIGNQEADL